MRDEFLGEDLLQVSVTPVRVAYLFRAGNREGFRRAVQEASSRWAGVTEPIVPVRRGGKVDSGWRQLTSFANVNIAVNVGLPAEDAEKAASAMGLQCVPLGLIDHHHSSRGFHWSAVAEAHVQVIAARLRSALWEMVAAGDPQEPNEGPSLLPVHRGMTEDAAGRAQFRQETVLDAGLGGYSEYSTSGGPWDAPALLWLTKPNSLADCLWFWNLRALRPLAFASAPMVILPPNALQDWIDAQNLINAMLRREFRGRPDIVLFSHSLTKDQLRDAAGLLQLRAGKDLQLTKSFGAVKERRSPSFTYLPQIDPRSWLYFDRLSGYSGRARVQRFRSRTIVPLDCTSLHDRRDAPLVAPVMLRISGGYVADLPRLQSVAALVEPNSSWRGNELEIGTVVSPKGEIALASPAPDTILEAVVAAIPGTCRVSDKGRLGAALFEAKDCSVLVRPGSMEIAKQLTTPRSKELLRELRARAPESSQQQLIQLARAWGGRAERRFRSAQNLAKGSMRVLEDLVAGGWAERGLESDCPRCGVDSFVPLATAQGPAHCLGCGAQSQYVGRDALQVMYRLDSLVDRATDQGVLPHLATLVLLRQSQPETHLHVGLEVKWPEGGTAEVDLFGFMGKDVVAGEVKVSPREFNAPQIDRDVTLSARLGAGVHVMATAGTIDPRSVADAQHRCDKLGLRLVTAAQGSGGGMVLLPSP